MLTKLKPILRGLQFVKYSQKIRFISMEAAKKAAGYAAIDKHVKVQFSTFISRLLVKSACLNCETLT